MTKVNKLNHSAAVLAQITAQINSKGVTFTLDQFLPYPMAEKKILSLKTEVMLTFLSTIDNLDLGLFVIASDSKIVGQVSSSYYWKSAGFIY